MNCGVILLDCSTCEAVFAIDLNGEECTDEALERAEHEGWAIGDADRPDLCPSCLDDMAERDRLGRLRLVRS